MKSKALLLKWSWLRLSLTFSVGAAYTYALMFMLVIEPDVDDTLLQRISLFLLIPLAFGVVNALALPRETRTRYRAIMTVALTVAVLLMAMGVTFLGFFPVVAVVALVAFASEIRAAVVRSFAAKKQPPALN